MRNQILYQSIIEYIDYDKKTTRNYNFSILEINKDELKNILRECEIKYNETQVYSNKTDHFKEYVDIKVPLLLKDDLEKYKLYLNELCGLYYESVGYYVFAGVNILPKLKTLIHRNEDELRLLEEKKIIDPKDVIYDNFKLEAIKNNYDKIEKDYIIEACNCAINGDKLAASTMIGCAAERLLVLLCEAYLEYLTKHGDGPREVEKFEKEILNAAKAHKRLDGFYKCIDNKSKLFETLGFENHKLNFSFLDIIRQVRNDSGHPTGTIIEKDKLHTIFSNYHLLYNKVHDLRGKLVEV